MTSTPPLVEVRELVKLFPLHERGKVVQAADRVSLHVNDGETVGLIGESGSGKTTVGRCIVRLAEPTAGEIYFRGERVDQLSQRQFRRYRSKMQVVFQEPSEALNPRMSVSALLQEPLRIQRWSPADRAERVRKLMDEIGVPGRIADRRPAELSAGTQQRVAIGRALAARPAFIVLDEPTSSLPPAAEDDILTLLRELQGEFRLSYLFISHDLTLVRHFCARVAVMYLGQVVESGALLQVFERPQHPYSRSLLASALIPDPAVRRRDQMPDFRLEGEIPSPVDLPAGCYLAGRCPLGKDRCVAEPQELRDVGEGHRVRCWRVTDGDHRWAEGSHGGLQRDRDADSRARR